MSRKCKRCGEIDFGIWGTIGLIGCLLLAGAAGYALADLFYFAPLPVVTLIFGLILTLPMFFIEYHETRDGEE